MKPLDWRVIIRSVKALGLVLALALLGALIADDLHQRGQVSTLTLTLQRSRPVTDYYIALAQTDQCRNAIRDRALAHFAGAFTIDRADAVKVAHGIALIAADQDQLDRIDTLCPYPSPPKFDDKTGAVSEPPGHGPPLPPTPTVP